jgi:hypothetical protein
VTTSLLTPARSWLAAIAAAIAAAALAGCSAFSTGSSSNRTTSSSSSEGGQAARVRQAQRTHEYPGPVPHQNAGAGSPSPVLAVEAFATGYINWTADTVSSRMRALAALSIGQARSEVLLASAQTGQDYELRRGGIANSGTVEAVAPMLGARDRYAVVTRELTTAANTTAYQGLRPAWHLALATVARVAGGGWVLSAWQPEN